MNIIERIKNEIVGARRLLEIDTRAAHVRLKEIDEMLDRLLVLQMEAARKEEEDAEDVDE